jgi:hypothetical protein
MISFIISSTISNTVNKALHFRNKSKLVTQSFMIVFNYINIAITIPVYVPQTTNVRKVRLEIHYGRQLLHGVRN